MKRLMILVWAVVALVGCSDNPMPGTLLGTYKVTAQSTSNTCGLDAPDPWAFDVQVSLQGDTVYWSWLDGSALLSGTESGSSASLTSEIEADVDATDAGPGPCTMMRTDTIDVTMAAGAQPASFTGTIGYAFSTVAGSNCGDQLTSAGGQYDAIPCSIAYTMTAARQ